MLSWNSILRVNVAYGYCEEALEICCRMRKLGVSADGFAFPLVIRVCALMVIHAQSGVYQNIYKTYNTLY